MTSTNAPRLECDLVMKGGVTSGIVYPPAILQLKDTYRFRCIGGTSAGAIAAAVAAAAEYGRESTRAESGFEELAAINERLARPPFMRDLFQPSRGARPLYRTILDAAFLLRADSRRRTGLALALHRLATVARWKLAGLAAIKNNPLAAFAGALVAGLLMYGLFRVHPMWGSGMSRLVAGFAALAALFLGALAGALIHLGFVAIGRLPQQGFGMCPGTRAGTGLGDGNRTEVLTDWLAERLDRLAGLEPDAGPLTFRHLAEKRVAGRDAGITLQMVTSNLSQQVPLLIPFATPDLIFEERDMRARFPESVVRYLRKHAGGGARTLPAGYHYLPPGDALPVIVATRLSLSFPVLLSAMRLYVVRASAADDAHADRALTPEDLLPLWFSDGGISSNFPVHLFDAWLPGRPTFGINLADLPAEHLASGPTADARAASARAGGSRGARGSRQEARTGPETFDAARFGSLGVAPDVPKAVAGVPDVYLPGPRENLPERWVEIKGLLGFVGQIWSTAQNHHDTTQMMLPGCRERVAQVLLASDEGGVNLDMPERTLRQILDKGRRAGEVLRERYAEGEGAANGFTAHQWIRYRVLMDKLEQNLMKWRERGAGGHPDYFALLRADGDGNAFGMDPDQRRRAIRRMEALALVVESWGAGSETRDSEAQDSEAQEERVLEALRAASRAAGERPVAPAPRFDDAARVFARNAPHSASSLRVTPLI